MITDAFDDKSNAIINPRINENAPAVDACILTFSYKIEKSVLENYKCKQIASFWFATGETPVYQIEYKGKKFAFYKTYVGAPACVGTVEDTLSVIKTNRYIVFGGAGCLNKEIAHGKIMIPTQAYRDEGTSYHYAPASDYVTVRNDNVVEGFMALNGIPYVMGKTWTTDSFYRETINAFQRHKEDGCISVEMECAALQAMCDFRGLNLYSFFTSGDLLDAPQWDTRHKAGDNTGTQHDTGHFDIALELAAYVSQL
jgi:uridine phosphorylase